MFLNSSIETGDDRISIDGYNLTKAYHPSDSKRSGVCIYYKAYTPLIKKKNDDCALYNCLVTEIPSQGEKCFLTCIYRSPSQSRDEFDDFCTKFDLLLSNINHEFPLYSVVKGYFNACCSRRWQNDFTNAAGQETDSLTLSAGYKQIIDKPIHIVNNTTLYTDLLLCTNQSAISNYGLEVSIFDKYHHNIIFNKVNIRVPLPPVYIREVWNYCQETWKILTMQYLHLIGVKLLKIFL